MFRANDFKNGDGENASPQTAADIVNGRLAPLRAIYFNETMPIDEWCEAIEKALGVLFEATMFPGKFEFETLGREKGPVSFSANNETEFFGELKKHLLSNDLEYSYHPEVKKGEVFVGGFRSVGVFTRSEINGQAN